LACAACVDLNPIRAGLAPTFKESQFTSARRRIQSLEQERRVSQRPALSHLGIIPGLHHIRQSPQNQMKVIGKNHKPQQFNPEARSKPLQQSLHPKFAVIIVLAGER